jgi:hypothetical protein
MAHMLHDHYVQWQKNTTNNLDSKIVEIMNHWQSRYELGKAVLVTDSPETALKSVRKNWLKITRHIQIVREENCLLTKF